MTKNEAVAAMENEHEVVTNEGVVGDILWIDDKAARVINVYGFKGYVSIEDLELAY